MPSSTPWRRRQSDSTNHVQSPVRPSSDSIERLSPPPFLASYVSDHNSARSHTREQPLLGLGLVGSSGTSSLLPVVQPDHIYIDQNGGAHVGAKVRATNKSSQSSDSRVRDGKSSEARTARASTKQGKSKVHTRSGSTIDDLANIAIATSPTLHGGSPTFPFSSSTFGSSVSRPATSYVNSSNIEDRSHGRPTKRVRSEKLHSTEWSPRDERPRTSHLIQQQSSMEDAELLLGLRNGYSFSTNTSPVFAPATTVQSITAADLIQPPALDDAANMNEPVEVGEVAKVQDEEVTADGRKDAHLDEAMLDVRLIESEEANESADPHFHVSMKTTDFHGTVAGLVDTEMHEDSTKRLIEPVLEPKQTPTPKKPRKIKPEIQAEVCAACQKLQRESASEDATTQWICCDYCGKWLHLACGGFKDKAETRAVDKFVCKDCEPQHGPTTFVRKSSRVRTAIDYAGLNQGVVKSSEESSMHHYIQPIKDRTIKYLNDDFARVRPELLTADFWENLDNMKRPFVVPACWNPRFGVHDNADTGQVDTLEASPISEPSFSFYDGHGESVSEALYAKIASGNHSDDGAAQEMVVDCDQDFLDMVMPRNLTVRKVAELYGPEQPVPVIDVKSQETKGQWTLKEWADYYEQQGEKPIRNVISLEVSNSPIGKLIRRPKAVRDIDLEDQVWDNDTRTSSNKRPVQFYCLMSVADSYTDFHIDFGGSSVYYHILQGTKTFFFIPPEDKNLKEYEKWCNSDTQNDTWLGDLCNGNVTRVDLHQGDTAFIPAGWIHSVWTPEDSLVIGGNFLTRLDYELQLRVANIEKATRVPQKFRYPFFQKVMWYALLKYLDEDPVPEEVLRDFHADEDFQYLRANPIWYEYGELASDAEPGEAGYNARVYPKSELNGLPYLRDYLYRTACIHADIPVPDVNKKQIDAVKASIPKGHGDPMRLIKTFAVWCAWKVGNESVPRWVHDQGDGLVSEIREREKAKEEVFRVPPERVSARNASKARAPSPVVEVATTPAKPAPSLDENESLSVKSKNGSKSSGMRVGSDVEANDSSSTKSKSGSRGGSLRVACDACRKRRIKCRHKEGDDNVANSSPPEIRPRTYSNVSVDIPKLASASPVSSAFDASATMNGAVQDFSTTSDLAQAALATMHSQSSDTSQTVSVTPNGGSAKKGRSKACEECRKSKRRCVHDEYGRIDPAKAAEPSKPRGSTNTKRQSRLSDEHPMKRHKIESDVELQVNDFANTSDIDMMIDPALMGDGFSLNVIHAPTESIVTHSDIDPELLNSSVPPPAAELLHNDSELAGPADRSSPATENVQQPHSPMDGLITQLQVTVGEGVESVHHLPAHMRQSPEVDLSYSPITVDGNMTESTERPEAKAEDVEIEPARSRQSSRRPRQADRFVAAGQQSPSKIDSSKGQQDSRASSVSERTLDTGVKSRRSSSNTSGMTHQAAALHVKQRLSQEVLARPTSRASSVGSDMDADERFARELQAAENGLRRRASMRA